MKHATTVRRVFEAGHQVEGHSICSRRQHGHRWAVSVTIEGGLDPKKVQVVDHGLLLSDLNRVIDEFDDDDLNEMLPANTSTPEGLGLYIRERLILAWPRITLIEVEMGESITVQIKSEIR